MRIWANDGAFALKKSFVFVAHLFLQVVDGRHIEEHTLWVFFP